MTFTSDKDFKRDIRRLYPVDKDLYQVHLIFEELYHFQNKVKIRLIIGWQNIVGEGIPDNVIKTRDLVHEAIRFNYYPFVRVDSIPCSLYFSIPISNMARFKEYSVLPQWYQRSARWSN